MKKFLVYLLVIVLTVSLGFAIFYLVRDNEVISISSASIYRDAGESFVIDVEHSNKKANTEITITSSDENIVKGEYDEKNGQYKAVAMKGGVARINVRTTNAKFRNLWCDVIVGDGTVDSPFYISTAEQLAAIGMGERVVVDGVAQNAYYGYGDYAKYRSDACYKLVADIDASTYNNGYWVPIQNFSGRFDGNGLTIKNIYIDAEGYKNVAGDSADIRFKTDCDAGIFALIEANSIVYNFKVENFMAVGKYSSFGVIAGVNKGTIERVEVKDAFCSVDTEDFGGIAGSLVSSEGKVKNADSGKDEFVINTAKIDRASVNNLELGKVVITDDKDNTTTETVGASGNIGGIVGSSVGGDVVYSYARGNVYLKNGSSLQYGGVVGVVWCQILTNNINVIPVKIYKGANVRDCYSDIVLHTTTSLSDDDIGGAIGFVFDFVEGTNTNGNNIVHNYIMGVYYNKDNLNFAEEGVTKNFGGIGLMALDGKPQVTFTDGNYVVTGLTTSEMKNPENFISYKVKEFEFNEDGTSKGIVDKSVYWLFDSVWAISADKNDEIPYLNYQLTYAPDNFEVAGIPFVSGDYTNYSYEIEIQYPVNILSGTEGKLKIQVGEFYQLVYSPNGIDITWKSSDNSVVRVLDNGKVIGLKPGSATITATTKTGGEDTITVIVENLPYSISAPDTIYLENGETYNLDNIVITPTPSHNDTVSYSVLGINGKDAVVAINGNQMVASVTETGSSLLIIKVGNINFHVDVVVKEVSEINLSAVNSSSNTVTTISGYLDEIVKTGTLTINNDKNLDLDYTASFESGEGIVDLSFNKSKLTYKIKNSGSATIKIDIATDEYKGKGSLYLYFNIFANEKVTLTMSQTDITGYYNSIKKTGSVTIKNSSGAVLTYQAVSSNTNVVDVTVEGNSLNYTIKNYGTANVTVKVTNDHYQGSGYVYFNILKDTTTKVDTIKLNASSVTIKVGGSFKIEASGTYSSIVWSTSDRTVATVNNGNVYGVGKGEAIITAKSDTAEAKCTVYVEEVKQEQTEESVSISLTPRSLNLNKGETYTLKTSGTYSSVSYSSSDTSIATVSSKGLVTAKAVGTAKITATAKDKNGKAGAYAYSYITITQPTTISLSASSKSCNVEETVTVTAVTNNDVVVDWTYDSTLASFKESGNLLTITTTKATSLNIIASYGSVSESIIITVVDSHEYNPYIYNINQLNAIRYNPDKTYYLCSSIDVGTWKPIDNFSGTLQSSTGHTFALKNMSVSGVDYAGLFGNNFKGTVTNINFENANISGKYAGVIAGKTNNGQISTCSIRTSNVTGKTYAGGVVGYAGSLTKIIVTSCYNNTVITTDKNSYVGGITGYATSSSILNCSIKASSIKLSATATGYAGGVVGYMLNTLVSKVLVSANNSILGGNTSSDFAGGISGYTNVGSSKAITGCTVINTNITGYNVGGISGGMTSSQSIKLTFKENKYGYRKQDLSYSNYEINVDQSAVEEGVILTGTNVGGLFGIINSGVVENCYARAELKGNSSSAKKAGIAVNIHGSTSFKENGGTGSCGLVMTCYSACTFSGSGEKFAATASLVHTKEGRDSGNKDGYLMNYVFDKTKAGDATYKYWPGLFKLLSKDNVQASKSSTDMQIASTYTDKGFSSSIWNFDGYPTLKSARK